MSELLAGADISGLPQRGKVVVGFSGGADSTALAHWLLGRLGPERLVLAHVNHQLRGEESQRDETFVTEWCEKRNIPLIIGQGDVAQEAKAQGKGVEETARATGVSRSCLYRAFQSEFGCSPGDYLTRYRIQRARELLYQSIHTLESLVPSSNDRYAINIAGAYHYIAECFRLEGRYEEAFPYYDKAIVHNRSRGYYPGAAVFYTNYGVCAFQKGEYEAAYQLFLYAMEIYDIIFFDWVLLCHSNFFPYFYPELKGVVDPHMFGYNKRTHIRHFVIYIPASAVAAWLCALL